MIHVRPYTPGDRTFVLGLAPRLAIGMQPWRDLDLWLATVEEWLAESISQHGQKTMVLIAENEQEGQLGFATVAHYKHFTGQPQAYIGELATRETVEGRGVGTALVAACEQWSREQGYELLTLSTGAGNTRALRFYKHLGFRQEDVTLTKLLSSGAFGFARTVTCFPAGALALAPIPLLTPTARTLAVSQLGAWVGPRTTPGPRSA